MGGVCARKEGQSMEGGDQRTVLCFFMGSSSLIITYYPSNASRHLIF